MTEALKIPPIIAHRGAGGSAPENTLASLSKARNFGASWVEFDVKLSQDGVPILMHDDTLDRTTNGSGAIAETSWEMIRQLDAGTRFHHSFTGERVPSLKETFLHLEKLNLGANIEIKPCPGREQITAETVAQLILEEWPSQLPSPLISSFSLTSLKIIRQISSHFVIGLLVDDLPENWVEIASSLSAISVHLNLPHATPENLSKIRENKFQPLVYTVNSPQIARKLFLNGAQAIFTDFPEIASSCLIS